MQTGSLSGVQGWPLSAEGRVPRGLVLVGVCRVGAAGENLGTLSNSLTPGAGSVASYSANTSGVTQGLMLGVTLATGSSATSFSRLRT